MPRKQVTRLRKRCGRLSGHLWSQAERVTAAADDLVRPWLPNDIEIVDLLHFQLCVGERLEALREELTAIDNQHAHELQVDRNLRQERDAVTALLREHMLQLRDSLNGLFGRGGGAKIFEDAMLIPPDPVALHQLAGHVRDNLADEEFPMPEPVEQGFTLDRAAAVRALDVPYQRLGTVLKRLAQTESESKYSQSEKNALVTGAAVFTGKADRFLEALYDLVGLDGLSDRVRRSSRRAANDEPGVRDPGDRDPGDRDPGDDSGQAPVLQPVPEPFGDFDAVDGAGLAVAA